MCDFSAIGVVDLRVIVTLLAKLLSPKEMKRRRLQE
jgi:hypothetical protein